jgi:thiamine-phosphate pyrophosphorylase
VKPLAQCRLYTFIDPAYLRGREPIEVARQLCAGGSDLIQLRAKDWSPEDIRRLAARLQPELADAGVGFVINDHPQIAREIGADLCHLGQEDFFDAGLVHASQVSGVPIGLSTHSPSQATRSVQAAPAYIAVGPVFPTATKPGAKAVTLGYVRWAAENVTVPWFAIGGITFGNVEEVLSAGAKRICVVGAILNGHDIRAACQEFRRLLPS